MALGIEQRAESSPSRGILLFVFVKCAAELVDALNAISDNGDDEPIGLCEGRSPRRSSRNEECCQREAF